MNIRRVLAVFIIFASAHAPQGAWAATKTPTTRLKRVDQALESIAGRARSTRYLMATGELAAGALYTFTGAGLMYGSIKYVQNPNLPATGLFPVDLGSAYVDNYTRGLGAVLGVGTGGLLLFMGGDLIFSAVSDIRRGAKIDRYYYGEFEPLPQKTEAEIEKKADLGERQLAAFADEAHRSRMFYGWGNLIAGSLMLIAATAHPDQPAGFFLGGGAGLYGVVTLIQESQPEDEYADYIAWKTDTPRDTDAFREGRLQLAALPTQRSLAVGLSLGF